MDWSADFEDVLALTLAFAGGLTLAAEVTRADVADLALLDLDRLADAVLLVFLPADGGLGLFTGAERLDLAATAALAGVKRGEAVLADAVLPDAAFPDAGAAGRFGFFAAAGGLALRAAGLLGCFTWGLLAMEPDMPQPHVRPLLQMMTGSFSSA